MQFFFFFFTKIEKLIVKLQKIFVAIGLALLIQVEFLVAEKLLKDK